MDKRLESPYNPKGTEERIYKLWENSGYFNPDNLPGERNKNYCIIMPPPNANGRLHTGHGLDMALKDAAIRFRRMQGYKALFLPGADHAGFETQVVYEKKLEKEGRSRFSMDPTDLYKEIYDFTIENKKYMQDDVRRLGTSCDWSREKFTLDPDIVKQVQDTFIKMHEDGLIYRGSRIVNWCPKHQTSLSDVETSSGEESAKFYYLKYGPFVIATARPETKFGDKHVVVHPDDERYSEFKQGQQIDLEWINGPITATVIKDEAIDMDFGTGAMTITPWHDPVDFEIAERHGLDKEQVIDERGKLLPIAGEFEGMKILEARERIIEKLSSKGLVDKIDEKYVHSIKQCYKCGKHIEPQIREQWFVKMAPLARIVLESVEKKGEIKILPDFQKKTLLHWMHNTIDWNISRQIIWGIPIPAWKKDGEFQVGHKSPGEGWEKDPDTFDTWFSSGQWPLLTLGHPDSADFRDYYPTDLMETGADLVFKWVPRMIMFGLYKTNKVPFRTVYFHGMINDAKNQKMSKSKGNVISPIDKIDQFGADALRMALVVGNPPGANMPLSDEKIKAYKHFANKIWNIARFVETNTGKLDLSEEPASLAEDDQARIDELNELVGEITILMNEYKLYLAAEKLYHYVWHIIADKYIEESKQILFGSDEAARRSCAWTLRHLLTESLKMLHPFMPFITEELWSILGHSNLLMIEKWPSPTSLKQ